jgi:hypothetical protein
VIVSSHRGKKLPRIFKRQGDLFMAKPDDPGSQGRSQAPGQQSKEERERLRAERKAARDRGEQVPPDPDLDNPEPPTAGQLPTDPNAPYVDHRKT